MCQTRTTCSTNSMVELLYDGIHGAELQNRSRAVVPHHTNSINNGTMISPSTSSSTVTVLWDPCLLVTLVLAVHSTLLDKKDF
jgi:hypothetical protein